MLFRSRRCARLGEDNIAMQHGERANHRDGRACRKDGDEAGAFTWENKTQPEVPSSEKAGNSHGLLGRAKVRWVSETWVFAWELAGVAEGPTAVGTAGGCVGVSRAVT